MKKTIVLLLPVLLLINCKKTSTQTQNTNTDTTSTSNAFFAKGADVSWTTQMSASGIQFYNRAGLEGDIYQVLKQEGINSIRLRAWVNPTDGWNNTDDVVDKAVRAKDAGMKVMIDFHYSDTWADPSHQTKPAAWTSETITQLQTSVHDYTANILNTLKSDGVIPSWVQVGNETSDGMLWPEGRASASMSNFASLVNAGYNAVKSVDTSIRVIVHLPNGYDNSLYTWMFDGLTTNSASWDIIGMSLYPTASNWQTLNTQCLSNMNALAARYNKPIMICEVGMSWTDSSACNAFLADIISKTKSVQGGKGLGVFYWEPEAYNNWQGYTLGAFDNSGKPTVALDAFK